jgi:putative ABC transport system permease protein
MSWYSGILGRLKVVGRRGAEERELAEEVRFHVEMETEENVRRGMAPADARRAAILAFGGAERMKDEVRDASGLGTLERLLCDLRFTRRMLVKSPGFAAAVIITLGLGIGSNAAIFGAVDGMVLNPFPFPQPQTLVGIGPEFPARDQSLDFVEVLSPAEIEEIASGLPALERVVVWDMGNRQVTIGGETENLTAAFWWGDAFSTLGVRPVLGRGFLSEEIERGERVAVLSHRVWQSRLGGDPDVLGGTIAVNGEPHTLVGVMPAGTLIYGRDLWVPSAVGPEVFPRDARQFQLLARLAPGSTLERLNEQLEVLARRVEAENGEAFAEYRGWRLEARTWNDINVGSIRPAAAILMAAVGLVLLLVCSNVATLLLARGTDRSRELAVRAALGASRGRIARQLFTENMTLGLLGGGLGIGIGWYAIHSIDRTVEGLALPIPASVPMNLRVLIFSAAVSILAGVLIGLLPALQASRRSLSETLRAAASSPPRGRLRIQRMLVAFEVALAFLLLAGGGLLIRSFIALQSVEPGFDTENLLTMRLSLARESYRPEQVPGILAELERRVGGVPGVSAVATSNQLPPNVFSARELAIEGAEFDPVQEIPTAYATIASPDYFAALALPVLRGRTFDETDRDDGRPVAVLNEAAAERFFAGEDPLGRRIRVGGPEGPTVEVVGIAGSTRNLGLAEESAPELFASSLQLGGMDNQYFLIIRTLSEPRSVLPAVRSAIRELDPQQPVYQIRTMEEAFASVEAPRRASTFLLSILGVFALVLAAVGIGSVVAYSANQRRKEIGVRLALGARASQVRWMVARQAMLPVAIGTAVGLAAILGTGRLMSSLLFEVSGSDPTTLGVVLLILGAIAAVACYLPARRASHPDPIEALRANTG